MAKHDENNKSIEEMINEISKYAPQIATWLKDLLNKNGPIDYVIKTIKKYYKYYNKYISDSFSGKKETSKGKTERERQKRSRTEHNSADRQTTARSEEKSGATHEKENLRYRELYERGTMLREEMIKLNSGDRGMTALRELYQDNKSNNAASYYKSSFEMRQMRLREVLKEYKNIKEELKRTPYCLPDATDISDFEELSRVNLDKTEPIGDLTRESEYAASNEYCEAEGDMINGNE